MTSDRAVASSMIRSIAQPAGDGFEGRFWPRSDSAALPLAIMTAMSSRTNMR
jgi:hypothetical protein